MAPPLLWLTGAPYDGSRARAALDVVMSFAAFAQAPAVLFSGDAVLGLVGRQADAPATTPSLRKVIESLPLYDVETIWVDGLSLAAQGIDAAQLPAFARVVEGEALRALFDGAGHVLSL